MAQSNIFDKIRQWQNSEEYKELHWTGTFEDYINLVRENPQVTRNAFQRLYDMIVQFGSQKYLDATKEVIRYEFFDDKIGKGRDAVFGLDVHLMKLVNILKAAALGYGVEKRVILLHGPVGSAKSTICRLLKKGLENYSATHEGALYTFDWIDQDGEFEVLFGKDVRVFKNPMHEEPLLLVPNDMRKALCQDLNKGLTGDYRVQIKGELCPPSRFIFEGLLKHYEGDVSQVLNHVRIRRLALDEANRVGIGTFQPKDEKNQDSTELTGDINYRKIAQYGSDSDPRAFNFDGEFNVANRGMVEFVEMLKLDVAFLYDLLGASQEHCIKPKKFAQTYIDEVIIGHTNEPEYQKLKDNEFMEALRDRTVKVDVPYITKWSDEVNIYKRDFKSGNLRGVSIAPHTIEMAAMWAVLTRLEKPQKINLTRLQKLKLYDGQKISGFTEDTVKELRKEARREGLHGISPRYIQDSISNAIVLAQQNNKGCVTSLMIFKELESGLKHHSLISSEEIKEDYREILNLVQKEYEEIIKMEVQKVLCMDEGALKRLFANYIDQVLLYIKGEKDVHEELMRSIENKIEIGEARKNDFRQELANRIEALAQKDEKFDYKSDERLYQALEKKLFEDQKNSIKLTLESKSAENADIKKKIKFIKESLVKDFGYDGVSAEEILRYVSDIFARGDIKNTDEMKV